MGSHLAYVRPRTSPHYVADAFCPRGGVRNSFRAGQEGRWLTSYGYKNEKHSPTRRASRSAASRCVAEPAELNYAGRAAGVCHAVDAVRDGDGRGTGDRAAS